MIEVNLFSVPASDVSAKFGSCVARARVDLEAIGSNAYEFAKGFIRDNLDNLEGSIGNSDLTQLINSNEILTTVDFATLKYVLKKIGYLVTIWNVAEDEENSQGVGEGTIEYNIVNHNFLQSDFPTATKLIPEEGKDIADILSEIVEQSGVFDPSKFAGVKNPFTGLLNGLAQEKENTGNINATIATQIYNILDQLGFEIFCATAEI